MRSFFIFAYILRIVKGETKKMKNIRLGLIGCGGMMATHATNINKVTGITITALCDLSEENVKTVAEALGNRPYVTTDYRTMTEEVDAVLVALPHDLHYECGLFFARHKKHILMEKPLCITEEECQRLIEVSEEEGVTLMCGYPVPYKTDVRKLKELVDSGEYGQIMQMSIWTEQLTRPEPEWSWARTSRLGGGQFFSHGCHYVDLLLRFLGDPVEGAHFGTRVGTPWLLMEGTSMAIFKFENGALGYHGATWGARGSRLGWCYQIMTDKGLLDYDLSTGEIRFYNQEQIHVPGVIHEGSKHYTVLYKREKEGTEETTREIAHFADCVLNGKRPLTDGREAMKSLQVIWRMYDAEKHGTTADLRGLGLERRWFDEA